MNGKKSNSMRDWLHTVLLAVCAVSLVIIAVLLWNWPKTSQTPVAGSEAAAPQTVPTSTTQTISIETAYGMVRFPGAWETYLEYEEIQADNGTQYVFSCRLAEETIELYRVIFGQPQADSLAGYLERDGQRIPVTVQSREIAIDGRNDEDVEVLKSMSGTFNDVLVSISEWDGFVYE